MVNVQTGRLVFVLIGCALAVGCGPNWDEISKVMDKQLEIERAKNDRLEKLQEKPSGNRSSEEGVAYQVRMAFFQMGEQDSNTDILTPALNYAYKVERMPLEWFGTFWNSPNTGLVLCSYPLDCNRGGSGGTQIGGKGSDFTNSNWTVATDGSVVAQDKAVAANRKSSVAQDEGMAATDDGKNVNGDGNTTAEAVSRPNTQSHLDFAGDGGSGNDSPGSAGDNNINSEGFGIEGLR